LQGFSANNVFFSSKGKNGANVARQSGLGQKKNALMKDLVTGARKGEKKKEETGTKRTTIQDSAGKKKCPPTPSLKRKKDRPPGKV